MYMHDLYRIKKIKVCANLNKKTLWHGFGNKRVKQKKNKIK